MTRNLEVVVYVDFCCGMFGKLLHTIIALNALLRGDMAKNVWYRRYLTFIFI